MQTDATELARLISAHAPYDGGRAALRVSWESASQLQAAVPRSFTLSRRRAVR